MDDDLFKTITDAVGFEWDDGNNRKNQDKHGVSQGESEQIFFNIPVLLLEDVKHSHREPRIHVYGKTDSERLLHITCTLRNQKIRVISARDMHKKERQYYEYHT